MPWPASKLNNKISWPLARSAAERTTLASNTLVQ